MLIDEKPKDFPHCIGWARDLFDQWFRNDIAQLLHDFPADHVV
jgi:ubiquitin-activating enzyme E1